MSDFFTSVKKSGSTNLFPTMRELKPFIFQNVIFKSCGLVFGDLLANKSLWFMTKKHFGKWKRNPVNKVLKNKLYDRSMKGLSYISTNIRLRCFVWRQFPQRISCVKVERL